MGPEKEHGPRVWELARRIPVSGEEQARARKHEVVILFVMRKVGR